MSLITRNAKEYRSMTAQLMSQNLPIVSCSFGIFCVLRHPNHFVLAGANNTNVIITYRFLAAPVQAIEIFSILTVWLYISTVSTFLNIRASYWRASSGFRLLGEIPAGVIIKSWKTEYISRTYSLNRSKQNQIGHTAAVVCQWIQAVNKFWLSWCWKGESYCAPGVSCSLFS